MAQTTSHKIIQALSFLGLVATIAFTLFAWQTGIFQDITKLQHLIKATAFWGPLLFILIQIIQVVVPIIPGGVSLAAGVIIFGPVLGFVYNYIGICIGSILNFLLARHYGLPFIRNIVREKTINKYQHWLDDHARFEKLFAAAIFLPIAPDDLLCLLAGLSQMTLRRFTWIILLGKPLSILLYSLGMVYGLDFLTQYLS